MKRRLTSLLLALCMVFTMLPDTVLAGTKVNKIVITMSKPQEGKALPTDAKVPTTASTKVTSVKWKGETQNGKAKANVKYTATITVEIKSGVKKTFASKASSINATVNGKKASVKRNNSTKITVTYTFPDLSDNSGETSENEAEVIRFGITHEKEDLNAKWASLKPTCTGTELYGEEPRTYGPYSTGKVRQELLNDALNTLNFSRYITGLNADVTLTDELNNKAQHGAVLLAAVGEMTHTPWQPGDMDSKFYQAARGATQDSNLYNTSITYASAKGLTPTLLSTSVKAYLDDQGVASLGHRLWTLAPTMKKTGFGLATGSNNYYATMEVANTKLHGTNTSNFDAVLWPAAGYHPTNFFQDGTVWSVQLNRFRFSAKASDLKIKVTDSSGKTQTCKAKVSTWNKDSIIKFTPSGKIKNGSKFDVEISGIKRGNEPVVFKYSVEFFKLDTKGTSDTPSTTKPTPTPFPTTAPGATPIPIRHDDIISLIHNSPSMIAVDNKTTEDTLAASLQELLPKDSGYTFAVSFISKNNATTTEEGLIFARVIFNDLAYRYSSSGESVLYHIPATNASDPEEAAKIGEDVKLIQEAFHACIASAKSKDDLTKSGLLKTAKNAVKNGSSLDWLGDPMFSTMSAKNGKDGYVKGTLQLILGAERREVEFHAILHPNGTITE